ncbi:MAG TPA: hypothetical protein VJU86_15710 [Pyrinomonadaceae bacterium]|nr:hypothetical protein [Pyrinomonadaceae bacterium]
MPPPPDNFFNTLNGVPVHYDREPLAPYGSPGVPYDFHATQEFESRLDACFAELEEVCPLGRPEVITSAGAWVNKTGYHGLGEAFDLDGIHWSEKIFIALNFPDDRRFYLGVDAVLRKHFPTVLNYYFNNEHHDHLHMDLGGQMGFVRVRHKVLFLQAALTYVLHIPVAIDGLWGPETSGGTAQALSDLNIAGQLENEATWREFLTAVSSRAFSEDTVKSVIVRRQTVNKTWFATVDDEPEFVVGREVSFDQQDGKGITSFSGVKYRPDDYREEYGFWADLIFPTAVCESLDGFFNTINTYDRAFFTFGFMQFAAHVFDGDFARYFRGLLTLPEAADYFPELQLENDRVHRRFNGGLVNLETNTNPSKLALYLNPDFQVIETREVENAARLIHWSNNSLACREMQVEVAVETFQTILRSFATSYSLDGKPDKVCLVIADLHHHGRGGQTVVSKIQNALDTNGDMDQAYLNLLQIGRPRWNNRIDALKGKVAELIAAGKLGIMKYSTAEHDFVPM